MKIQKLLSLLFVATIISAPEAWAQADQMYIVEPSSGTAGNYFMAILAGFLLAIGFQFLLTILSAASGISLIGNIHDRFDKASTPHDHDKGGSPLVKITSSIGAWVLITTSISLFFASLLGVKMSHVANDEIGITLGLVIWASFFVTMLVVEMRTTNSILGTVINTALGGVRASGHMLQGIFGKSQAHKTAEAIREEIVHTFHDPHLKNTVKDYVRRFQAPPIDWNQAKKELTKMLGDFELKADVRDKEGEIEQETFIRLAHKHPHFSKRDIHKLGRIYSEVKDSVKGEGKGAEKILKTVEKFTPVSAEDTQHIRQKIEEYLRSTGVAALNPENLKEDLNKIFSEPKSTKSVVLNRIKQFDHPTLVSIVSQKTNISQEEANRVINRVESALQSIKECVVHTSEKARDIKEGASGGTLKSAAEERVRQYFSSLQRPEFDYDAMKSDFERMLHDPKGSPEILKTRLKEYNRDSLIALISTQPHVSQDQAEQIVSRIEAARDNVLQRIDDVEAKVKEKSEEAKELALRQAEYIRQSVALAAWWLMGTAVFSAGSAALGGMLALS